MSRDRRIHLDRQLPLPIFSFWTFVISTLAAPGLAAPVLDVTTEQVSARGVTPQGCTIFFGVSHERAPWMRRLITHAAPLVDRDGDGLVALELGVAATSVWAAVDVVSGAHSLAAPAGFAPQQEAIAWRAMTEKPGVLIDQRQDLELLVVRPDVAAWHGRAFDGAAGDAGLAEDGAVEARLADLERIWPDGAGTVATLEQLEAGDVVVGIDPSHLTTWSFVFEAPQSDSGRSAQ
ncbi:MAG: hypothetical protein AAF657_29075 [Acidobacteriota bacterium]